MSKKRQPDMRKFHGADSASAVHIAPQQRQSTPPAMQMVDPDPRVQNIYEILISDEKVPASQLPWERWAARRIVAALPIPAPSTPQPPAPVVPLTDEQCDQFRRLPVSFNDMVRAIYELGKAERA